ncbi:MAG: NAD(P)/FAD-dependent oxidoreductase [Xanthobacteraceae bacterium]
MKYDAIAIGAGTNGLVAATLLAKAGRQVLLVEQSDAIGGTARLLEFAPGFRAAPLGMDPGWLPPSVARAVGLKGVAARHAAAPLTLAVQPREFLTLWSDVGLAAEAIGRHSPKDAEAWPAFASKMDTLAGFLERVYRRPPLDLDSRSPRELLSAAGLALAFRGLGRAYMTALLRTLPMPVQDLLDDWFECEPLKAALAPAGVQHLRQGPRSAGTAFVLLHHLVGAPPGAMRRSGRWSNEPGGVVAALEQAARQSGVAIRTAAKVRRIQVNDDAVTGVVLESGEEIAAPVVLSSADPARTLLGMVDPVWLNPEFLRAVGNIKFRGCTAVVAYALDRLIDLPGLNNAAEVLAGTVTLTRTREALERAYDDAKYGRVSERPHVEITVPTLATPSDAPDGKHVLLARMQYAPYHLRDGTEWDTGQREALADSVTKAVAEISPAFADRVRHRAVFAPTDFEHQFGLTEGAAYQGELMLDQILFMRPLPGWSRYRMPVDGLYLCGSGTHPGGGVTGAPGHNAAREILRDFKRRRLRRARWENP